MNQTTQTFETLLEENLAKQPKPGDIVTGTVILIDDKYVSIDLGLKAEGVVHIEEFRNVKGDLLVDVGDETEVVVEEMANFYGETPVSREKARRIKTWDQLTSANRTRETVTGTVMNRVKGGFTVEIDTVKAFLPGSLVSTNMAPENLDIEGQEMEFKVIKMDNIHNNVVVSRKAVLEEANSAEREKLLETLEEGQIIKGMVKNMTDYGAFVDLGGVDGLLHITDISWKRIKSPSEMLKLGETVTVVILKFDRENCRISLGMKQLREDPWVNIQRRYPKGTQTNGKVTNITDYGCFVEIERGIEGLVHMSEMDWTNKNVVPSKFVQMGQEVDVIILDIDEERRRISLGMKQCTSNPWTAFAETHKEGEVIKGKIKSITDFGLFIGSEGDIDGLVHLSDISWTEPGEQAVHHYKKGDEIEAVIMNIDPERERISLGIKQLQNDPFGNYVTQNQRGVLITAKVKQVESKQAFLDLAEDVVGVLKLAEFASDNEVSDLTEVLNVDDELTVRITGVNYKDRLINVSMKAKAEDFKPKDAVAKKQPVAKPEKVVNTTLGDLLKEQLAANQREQEEDLEEEDLDEDSSDDQDNSQEASE